MNATLVRVIKQPPSVTHYIFDKVGIVMQEQDTGGVTWLELKTIDKEGKHTGWGWVPKSMTEPVTDASWVEAYDKWSLFQTEFAAKMVEVGRQRKEMILGLANKYNLTIQDIEDIHHAMESK